MIPNVLVSGTLWDGLRARLVEAWESGEITLILSPQLTAEFTEVLSRPKFAARLTLRYVTPQKLVARLRGEAVQVVPEPLPPPAELRDRKDLHVLEAAVSAQAYAIVTRDEDLLTMKSFAGIPILTVGRKPLERLGLPA